MVDFLRTTFILTVVALVFMFTVQARILNTGPEECLEPNEEYNSCGSACPVTCEDIINSNSSKPCTYQCVLGCFCQEGYVRENEEPKSRCIKTIECYSAA